MHPSGRKFELRKSDKTVEEIKVPVELKVGTKAHKFTAKTTDGKTVNFPGDYAGKIVMLDFWATWCGPCKKAIPHMDQISDTRGAQNVHVIGVAIWPRPNMVPTPDFVREKGDAMSYRICEDVDGRTAAAFMEPTGSNGIPTCMVVGKTGQLEWVGHPMAGMDEVLDQVLAGTWDSAAFAAELRARLEREAKADAIQQELGQATEARDWAGVARLANQLYELDAEQFGGAALMSYDALLRARQAEQAATYGRKLVESFKDVPQALNALAWTIVEPGSKPVSPTVSTFAASFCRSWHCCDASASADSMLLMVVASILSRCSAIVFSVE